MALKGVVCESELTEGRVKPVRWPAPWIGGRIRGLAKALSRLLLASFAVMPVAHLQAGPTALNGAVDQIDNIISTGAVLLHSLQIVNKGVPGHGAAGTSLNGPET